MSDISSSTTIIPKTTEQENEVLAHKFHMEIIIPLLFVPKPIEPYVLKVDALFVGEKTTKPLESRQTTSRDLILHPN